VKHAPVTLVRVASVLKDAGLLREGGESSDVQIRGVSQDSRSVGEGDLFLAWSGVAKDAHDFVKVAERAGAVAAVVERPVADVRIPQLVVSDGRSAGALAADLVLGSPWKELFLVAVTGTNGKTTTTLILRHVLMHLGPAATVGTLGLVQPDGSVRLGTEGLTTPGPVQLLSWLRDLADAGVKSVTMEASSHALDQHRLDALRADVAVFTNFTQDHLDYHKDLAGYFKAKARLVGLLDENGTLVVNSADPAWRELPDFKRRLSFAVNDDADVQAADVSLGPRGSSFRLVHRDDSVAVTLPLPGRFNVENALAAAAAALVAGVPLPVVAERLGSAPQVPGRLEVVVQAPCTVLIDYAHTPDALKGVLDALRPLVRGRLLVLFGAGGDRDRTKRRPMAEAVAARADHVFLTSDNPRTEDPEAILDDLEKGLAGVDYERVADRREAIRRALAGARPDDVLLLAGKGHETYQIVGTEKRPFDERVVVREFLERGAA
jgi:UDP-N-acetylmuramoyl-L-alanyl-D-glutamate--2,6-diaminopimelate ligase